MYHGWWNPLKFIIESSMSLNTGVPHAEPIVQLSPVNEKRAKHAQLRREIHDATKAQNACKINSFPLSENNKGQKRERLIIWNMHFHSRWAGSFARVRRSPVVCVDLVYVRFCRSFSLHGCVKQFRICAKVTMKREEREAEIKKSSMS